MPFVNQLEPAALLRDFCDWPAEGFSPLTSVQGCPGFTTRFDLLTTTEPALQQSVRRWPGYRAWSRILRPKTCFIGSTVSEYAWLPDDMDPDELALAITRRHASVQALLIIKDLPHKSPLLDTAQNEWNEAFAKACVAQGFVMVQGQALAWVPIDFTSEDEYLAARSRSARRDIRRKLRARAGLEIEELPTGSPLFDDDGVLTCMYGLYSAVYAQSEVHFDCLRAEFFSMILRDGQSQGVVFVYRHGGRMIGWNLCYVHAGNLIDKYVGFTYPEAREHNLYALSWMHNLDYARRHGLRNYVAGWTDPAIKVHLGARLTFTRHAVRPRSRVLRFALRRLARHFESDRQWYEEHAHDPRSA